MTLVQQDSMRQQSDSTRMKLACYDFKLTPPFVSEEVEERRPNTTSWWRSCWDCSILPEDDRGIESAKRVKNKTKQNQPSVSGPIAEGLEEELEDTVKIPSIMTGFAITLSIQNVFQGKDQEVPFSSVIVQQTESVFEKKPLKEAMRPQRQGYGD